MAAPHTGASPPDERTRPADDWAGTSKADHDLKLDASLGPLDDIARHVDGTFVLVVKLTGGKYRRRCFLTAKAAEAAVRRATDNGFDATIYLAELKPLWKLAGGRDG